MVRKSTFFNILTKSSVPAENFPFCTINPNESKIKISKFFFNFNNTILGRVPVPDARFDFLCQHYEPLRYFIDKFLRDFQILFFVLANNRHISM